jgi:hypothetical protein
VNHKRHRPKNRRAGCLLCKPHKANGMSTEKNTPTAALRQTQDSVQVLHAELELEFDGEPACSQPGQ